LLFVTGSNFPSICEIEPFPPLLAPVTENFMNGNDVSISVFGADVFIQPLITLQMLNKKMEPIPQTRGEGASIWRQEVIVFWPGMVTRKVPPTVYLIPFGLVSRWLFLNVETFDLDFKARSCNIHMISLLAPKRIVKFQAFGHDNGSASTQAVAMEVQYLIW
jgi:hypothetical protein